MDEMTCKVCGEVSRTEVCRYCEKLKDDLQDLLEQVGEMSDLLGMNLLISATDKNVVSVTANDYFSLRI